MCLVLIGTVKVILKMLTDFDRAPLRTSLSDEFWYIKQDSGDGKKKERKREEKKKKAEEKANLYSRRMEPDADILS